MQSTRVAYLAQLHILLMTLSPGDTVQACYENLSQISHQFNPIMSNGYTCAVKPQSSGVNTLPWGRGIAITSLTV